MGRRFSRIRNAAYLNQAVDNYITYLQTSATRPRRVGQGAARPPQVDLAITPFVVEVATGERFLARVAQPSRAQLGPAVGTAVQEVGGAITAAKQGGWTPAKITMFAGTGTRTVATSAITGLQYNKYAGTSYAHPFGKAADGDEEYSQFLRIKTALAGTNRRFSIQSERQRQT